MSQQQTTHVEVDISHWKVALRQYGGRYARKVLVDPKLVATTFDLLREISEKHYCDAVATGLVGADALTGKSRLSTNIKLGVKSTTFVVSQFKLTMGLRAIGKLSPGRATVAIGSTMVVKTGLLLGLTGDANRRLACTGALMEVGGNVAFTAATFETGVGAALGLASIAASGYDAYLTCTGEH